MYCLGKLTEFRAKIQDLKKLKSSRKDNRILMQSEERKFREGQEKAAKDLTKREERFNAQKAEYEELHQQFLIAIDQLAKEKVTVFGDVFHAMLFFQGELCELQRRAVVETTKEMELESVRERLPTCLTKIDLGEVRGIETLLVVEE
jgi:hypothetical protein